MRFNGLRVMNISIHAPTRGATRKSSWWDIYLSYFNPRSYKRSDSSAFASIDEVREFQSTLLQEERPVTNKILQKKDDFNPRSYKRSDVDQIPDLSNLRISIHAPTRGATPKIQIKHLGRQFQSTLLQEERQQKCTIFLMHLCNNYCIVSI